MSTLCSRSAGKLLLRIAQQSPATSKCCRIFPTSITLKRAFGGTATFYQKTVTAEAEHPFPAMKSDQSSLNTDSNVQDVSNLQRLEKCINTCQLMGRVGSEPQLRGTEEHPVLLFSLATHTQYRDETGKLQQKTFWHRVAVFRDGLRETCFKYCRKGQRVYLTGEIQYSNVKDPETNYIRTVTSIVVDDVILLA